MLVISYVFKSKFLLRFTILGFVIYVNYCWCTVYYVISLLIDDSNFLHVNCVLKDDLLLIGWSIFLAC